MKRYPRSFLQLVTLGHLFALLPFLVAGWYVFNALEDLNDRYQAAIDNVAKSSHLSGELAEDLIHMERALRRYDVLRNEESLDDYRSSRAEWQENLTTLARLPPLTEAVVQKLKGLKKTEEALAVTLEATTDFPAKYQILDALRARQENALMESRALLEQEQAAFRTESDALIDRLMLAAALAMAVTLCCLWLVRRLLARLIGGFERAVLSLGRGDLQQAISLDGPGDMRWLGRWLEWLRRRLLSLEENRTLVLRHVSHELKTPLAAMHEGAALLGEKVAGPLTAEQERIIGILHSNSRRLQDLIEGLLRLQQAEHASERLNHERLAYDQLVELVLDTYRLSAQERHIRLELDLAPTEIVAGREALMTLIHNLVSNAVKYTPDHGTVRIALHHDSEQACLDVFNSAAPIPPADSAKIFEPFYRGHGTRGISGAGLGLAIAREFALAHRGSLQLVPEMSGVHFRVTLPLQAAYLRLQPG